MNFKKPNPLDYYDSNPYIEGSQAYITQAGDYTINERIQEEMDTEVSSIFNIQKDRNFVTSVSSPVLFTKGFHCTTHCFDKKSENLFSAPDFLSKQCVRRAEKQTDRKKVAVRKQIFVS